MKIDPRSSIVLPEHYHMHKVDAPSPLGDVATFQALWHDHKWYYADVSSRQGLILADKEMITIVHFDNCSAGRRNAGTDATVTILLESGFCSNDEDKRLLVDALYRYDSIVVTAEDS